MCIRDSSSSKEQTSGGTSGEVATGDDNFNETGLPIVKEPVELTFLYVKGAKMCIRDRYTIVDTVELPNA